MRWANRHLRCCRLLKGFDKCKLIYLLNGYVLSQSGVGKSSFLLKIHNEIEPNIDIAIFQDARNFRGSIDLLSLLQEFVEVGLDKNIIDIPIPTARVSILDSIAKIDTVLEKTNSIGAIFVDQFESMFSRPELYSDFLDLVLEIIHRCKNIVVCIARKNDQPTTFDERDRINLQRLRQISRSVELTDFLSKYKHGSFDG